MTLYGVQGCSGWLERAWQVAVAFLVVFPLDVFYWRGTWDLLDHYCAVDCRPPPSGTVHDGHNNNNNNNDDDDNNDRNASVVHRRGMEHENYRADCLEFTGNWITSVVGASACLVLNGASPLMQAAADDCGGAACRLASRLYSYGYALAYLGQWRGTWNLVDAFCDDYEWRSNLAGLAACLALNFALRLHQHWTSSPWHVDVDAPADVFVSTPWLRSKPEDSTWHYWIDQLLSQVICVSLNIATWRCFWNILDDAVYPDSVELSAALTLGAGAVLLLALVRISGAAAVYGASLDGRHVRRSLFDGSFYVVVNLGVVSMWRGLWNLVAEYVVPDRLLGGIVCHVTGTVGLMAMMSFRTVYANSVDLDGEEERANNLKPHIIPVSGWLPLLKKNNKGDNGTPLQDDAAKSTKTQDSSSQGLMSYSSHVESV